MEGSSRVRVNLSANRARTVNEIDPRNFPLWARLDSNQRPTDYELAALVERVWRVKEVVGTENVPIITSSRPQGTNEAYMGGRGVTSKVVGPRGRRPGGSGALPGVRA